LPSRLRCIAHAQRKFYDLHANHKSQLAEQALAYVGQLYDIERDTAALTSDARRGLRQQKALPVAEALHAWMTTQRQKVPKGSAIAKALDYTLDSTDTVSRRWRCTDRQQLG
jgi:transposase